jgi:hypothetical protein
MEGIEMKTAHLVLPLLLATLHALAPAAPIGIEANPAAAPQRSTLTRAEVLADLHVWRLSGLEELARRNWGPPDTSTTEYLQARQTYESLRASDEFPALVEALRRHPFAPVRIR